MVTYISILRGINVSGQKLIRMEALRKSYEALGFQTVTSYVQSGNVLFRARKTETEKLAKQIANQIKTDFGFEVPVMVLTIESLRSIIENNPFSKDKEPGALYVTFLSSASDLSRFDALKDKLLDDEELAYTPEAIYMYCPKGYGKTKLSNNFLETKLRVMATTRNWKTTNELLKMALEM